MLWREEGGESVPLLEEAGPYLLHPFVISFRVLT